MRGKKILVTGGGRGIGEAIVTTLAADGFDIMFTFHSADSEANSLLTRLRTEHPNQTFEVRQVNLAERGDVEALANDVSNAENLYGLVHNAGMTYDSLTAAIDQRRAETLMQVNFWSMIRLVKASVRPMVGARSGRIVAVGSIAALHGAAGNAAYAASKGALLSYVKTLAVELSRKGVSANYIAPGYVDTDMILPYASRRKIVEQQIPAGRFAHPWEVAGLVRYLMTPEAGYMSGNVIPFDGGLSAALMGR